MIQILIYSYSFFYMCLNSCVENNFLHKFFHIHNERINPPLVIHFLKKHSLFILLCTLISCTKKEKPNIQFTRINSNISKITFQNTLTESDSLNYFTYPYIYMGGGIAVGDFNNDDLQDIYFTGNMVPNKLYLNKGNLTFEDITDTTNTAMGNEWFLGATTVDINNDGWLDLYLSISGKNKDCPNKLLINQGLNTKGKITFKEQASIYGIADKGHSSQSTFFDYDNDGDLDLYVANYPITPFKTPPYIFKKLIEHATSENSNHLYRNNGNNTFTDVTQQAKLLSYSLSLSATVSDLNNDGYKDIYVSNDFASADFCYINQRDGTFKNTIEQSTKHTALYGMGLDIADYNNDGYLDVFQADMDASTNQRSKANMASMNPDIFWETQRSGLHYQYMHNCLQLNTGLLDSLNRPLFNNVSRIANVSTTDWSWGGLFADFNNDGWKDLFVSNGTRREINNTDFFNKIAKNRGNYLQKTTINGLQNTLKIPSEKTDNFVFENAQDLTFKKVNAKWGLEYKGFSNGVAYADLDNDGDLDIILNNIDDEALIFRNNNIKNNHYISLQFQGPKINPRGIGVSCTLISNGQKQYQELSLERGYISSMPSILHFGIEKQKKVDTLSIKWPDGKSQLLTNINANSHLKINYNTASYFNKKINKDSNYTTIFSSKASLLDTLFKHKENQYNDFKKEILLPHKTSTFGPYVSVGDVNNDSLDDFFIGGASGQSGGIFIQTKEGRFLKKEAPFIDKSIQENMGSLFFDADNDGDLDLYIAFGGNEFDPSSPLLQDYLYKNDGTGDFSTAKNALPKMHTSGSRVYSLDYDKDGDYDLLVCGRLVPGNYPSPAKTYLLENISTTTSLKFMDVTDKLLPQFSKLGLATGASIADINNDGWKDIVIVGEWMPIRVFKNNSGKGFTEISGTLGLKNTTGWWFSVASGDFDNDGDIDFITGNLGLNYKYKSTENESFDIYFDDFDQNNKNDIVLSYHNNGKKYPVRGRSCSSSQVHQIKDKFKTYNEFANATLVDIYGKDKLSKALHYKIDTFATTYIENRGSKFILHQLPNEIQLSSINTICIKDFNADGNLDILGAGNLYASEIETPRNDAGTGVLLYGNGDGTFKPVTLKESGFYAPFDVKDMSILKIGDSEKIIVANNNSHLKFIDINNKF